MDKFLVRRVKADEIESLQRISRRTFYETFWMSNTHQNIIDYLENSLSLEALSRELENPNSEFYFLFLDAESATDFEPAAYLKLNFLNVELERIYVLSKFQCKGIGRYLLDFSIQLALSRRAPILWLGVWERNYNAIDFYKQNIFQYFGKHTFRLGQDLQTDILMQKILLPNG
ncbi:GNAT family N-acetyltransferase [Bacteroidales bacterium MB20-C3-3]|nr:GNAT family N-acetyltransferase [Bacteroidales bacterium MB20-C3-3]